MPGERPSNKVYIGVEMSAQQCSSGGCFCHLKARPLGWVSSAFNREFRQRQEGKPHCVCCCSPPRWHLWHGCSTATPTGAMLLLPTTEQHRPRMYGEGCMCGGQHPLVGSPQRAQEPRRGWFLVIRSLFALCKGKGTRFLRLPGPWKLEDSQTAPQNHQGPCASPAPNVQKLKLG